MRLSVWLVPEPPQALRIQPMLAYLAARYQGPSFQAHLTVFAGSFNGETAVLEELARLAASTPPLELRCSGVDRGETFTQCLFARFEHDPVLTGLCESVRPLALDPKAFELDPHLSLYYGDPQVAERAISTVAFPYERVRFDRLALNVSHGRTIDASVVETWEQLGTFELLDA